MNRKALFVAFGVILGIVVVAASAHAWSPSGITYLTFSRPVALPGVTLGAGSYTFERVTPDVVRVRDRANKQMYFVGFTRAITRPRDMSSNQHVNIGEAPAGLAPPIKAWFPEGYSFGHEFIYSR